MSIASIVTAKVGPKGSRRQYRDALVETLANYQGDQYDDPGSFGEQSGPVQVGEMYFFNYIATKPERLEYYDQYPVSYVMFIDSTGFIAANMHYLAPKLREATANSLLNSGDGITVPKRSIRRYRFEGLQGNMMRIPESEMADVSMLPTEEFINVDTGRRFPSYRVWRGEK
ncbi:DNA end protector protein [Synechococcus phage S-8S55]|jgi:hypothetical protein|nr:DNA end protector protein [Synechococcus phage S-8S55]